MADSMVLVHALEKHKYDEWYSALLHAALQELKDPDAAVRQADELFGKHPTDPSKPHEDDIKELFAATPKQAVEMSATSAPHSLQPTVDAVIDRGLPAGLELSKEVRARVLEAVKKKFRGSSETESG